MAVAPQLVDISKHEFKEPQRLVKVPEDMDKWFTCQVSCLHARLYHARDNCETSILNHLHAICMEELVALEGTKVLLFFLCVILRSDCTGELSSVTAFYLHSSFAEGLVNCVIVTPELVNFSLKP